MIGVTASHATREAIITAGVAGLVAGSMSMAVGEYMSVSSQRDAERADIAKETHELAHSPESELDELTGIYINRGLTPELSRQVAIQLTENGALESHLRDELGLDPNALSHPMQASWVSACSFASFASLPIGILLISPADFRVPVLFLSTLFCLVILGVLSAHLGGAAKPRAALRILIGGTVAMGFSAAIGKVLGVTLGG
jgi:VIT1/CCC1 family predicted Fe2+/Mn2+ transporter